MSDQSINEVMTNREFVALVREKLDAAGHADIPIERAWIDQDTAGEPWLLHVPVGTELSIPLRPNTGFFGKPASDLDFEINVFTKALVNLRRAEKSLIRYARSVRRAANEEIASARADGLDLLLKSVGFNSVYASHLSSSNWKDAAMCVIATVEVGCLSFNLQPETMNIIVDYPENIADEFAQVREEQRERQQRIAEMAAAGYDLETDAITLDILSAHRTSAAEVLKTVWKRQHMNTTVPYKGEELRVFVGASDGSARTTITLPNALWNGEHLWFRDAALANGHAELVGKTLGDLVDHPAFTSRLITKVDAGSQPGRPDLIHFDMSERLLFDAETGRFWPKDVKAA